MCNCAHQCPSKMRNHDGMVDLGSGQRPNSQIIEVDSSIQVFDNLLCQAIWGSRLCALPFPPDISGELDICLAGCHMAAA